MAEVVTDDLVFKSRTGVRRYAKYLDGQSWKLTRGVDFACGMSSLKASLTNTASGMNRLVSTRIDPTNKDVIYVRSEPK